MFLLLFTTLIFDAVHKRLPLHEKSYAAPSGFGFMKGLWFWFSDFNSIINIHCILKVKVHFNLGFIGKYFRLLFVPRSKKFILNNHIQISFLIFYLALQRDI